MKCSMKRRSVYAVRDFPPGCGTQSSRLAEKAFKNPKTIVAAKKSLSTAASPSNGTCAKQEPADHRDHFVGASSSSLRKALVIQNSNNDPNPREKVLKVLSLFKQVYRKLDQDKAARRDGLDATSRIDLKTLEFLEKKGKQVNAKKRIGSVPGIHIGDVFQYKTELRLVGLHSKTMCGIDYMKVGDVTMATSIVSSDGYGYNDRFSSGVMVYTGEGGNVISQEDKTENQKLVRGNLALANSMKRKSEVRVIRGEERGDHKGKRYVYDGLYLVDEYWSEMESRGKTVYKFKLSKIPGQHRLT